MHPELPARGNAWKTAVFVTALLVVVPAQAAAQAPDGRLEASVHMVSGRSFGVGDTGVGGRVSWTPFTPLGLEAAFTVYPAELASEAVFSRRRLEGLFGITVGPRLARVRPFARLRSGFLAVGEAPEPLFCVAVYPPPVFCELASGATLPTVDIGGGLDVFVARRAFLRIDLGDRLVRVRGPVVDRSGTVRNGPYFVHGFRFEAGAGLRF